MQTVNELLEKVKTNLVKLGIHLKSGQYTLLVDALEVLIQIRYLIETSQPTKLTEAIQNMISIEEAAHHCPDCGVGGFCLKHDMAFMAYWGVVKNNQMEQERCDHGMLKDQCSLCKKRDRIPEK